MEFKFNQPSTGVLQATVENPCSGIGRLRWTDYMKLCARVVQAFDFSGKCPTSYYCRFHMVCPGNKFGVTNFVCAWCTQINFNLYQAQNKFLSPNLFPGQTKCSRP